jgi:hypothetical protein
MAENDWVSRIPDLSRIAAVVVGSCYVIGLVIVNMELAQHGIVNLDLGRAQYVLVGFLWIAVTGLGIGWFTLMLLTFERAKDIPLTLRPLVPSFARSFVAKFERICVVIFGQVVLYGVLIWLPVGLLSGPSSYRNWLAVINAILSGCMSTALILLSPLFARAFGWQWLSGLKRIPTSSAIVAGVMAFMSIWIYAVTVYPYLSTLFGGGRPHVVQLTLRENANLTWPPGMPVSSDGRQAGPVAMLLETSGFIVVTSTETLSPGDYLDVGTPAIEINKDLVSLILHDSAPHGGGSAAESKK